MLRPQPILFAARFVSNTMALPFFRGGGEPPPTPSPVTIRPPPEPPPESLSQPCRLQFCATRSYACPPSTTTRYYSATLSALHLPRSPHLSLAVDPNHNLEEQHDLRFIQPCHSYTFSVKDFLPTHKVVDNMSLKALGPYSKPNTDYFQNGFAVPVLFDLLGRNLVVKWLMRSKNVASDASYVRSMQKELFGIYNYIEIYSVMIADNSLLSLVIWSSLVFRPSQMGLGEDSQDPHRHNCSLTQLVLHNTICLVECSLPSTPPILGTTRCIGIKRCNWCSLPKLSRRGKIDQGGSVKTLIWNSDPKVAVNKDEPHQGWPCSSAKVELHKVPSRGPMLRPPKPPDC